MKSAICSFTLVAALAASLLAGCTSQEESIAKRRERLLALYPPGTTTRKDVTARWGQPARESFSRPSPGWAAHESAIVSQRCLTSEQRTGKPIASCERRHGADGLFGLCYCWFYYDRRDRLVDVDWQWASD